MTEIIVISISSQTASFRNPEFQNFHKTYDIPPPSTIIGLTGAAIGLSPQASQQFFKDNIRRIGISGISKGIASDLWKYDDFGNGSVITREILYDYSLSIVFESDKEGIAQIIKGFRYPKYALTLGNSDSLAKVNSIIRADSAEVASTFSHCLISGDVIEDTLENAKESIEFSLYQTSDPIVNDMPVYFQYSDSEYGPRNLVVRKKLSTVGNQITLNYSIDSVRTGNKQIPLFSLS